MVNDKDRKDYEEGRRVREKGTISQVMTDLSGNHPGTDAYYKGRRGGQLIWVDHLLRRVQFARRGGTLFRVISTITTD